MSRAELYQKLLKAAAKQLGVKPSSESAKDLAVLRLARETITSKLISGRDVDPSALRWLVEELAKFAPPPETPKVELTIVEGITGICPACKAEVHPWEPPPTEIRPPPAPSAAPTNVVALPRPRSAGQPITDTMRRFNRLRGYGVAPDGRLGRGNPSRGGAVW